MPDHEAGSRLHARCSAPTLGRRQHCELVMISAALAPIGKLAVYRATGNRQMKHFVAVRKGNGND